MGLSKDLLREINDLLDQAKYDARALVLDSTLFELRDQMERLRLVLEPVAVKKNLAFVVDVDPRIQDRVQGDSHYLSKVLINLAGNAVKFTEKGKVEIAITLLDKNGRSVPHKIQRPGHGDRNPQGDARQDLRAFFPGR